MYFELTLCALLIDKVIGEFSSKRHPVVLMGGFIDFLQKRFYADSIAAGAVPALLVPLASFLSSYLLVAMSQELSLLGFALVALAASTAIAANMLEASVRRIESFPHEIAWLVSRDTQNMSSSERYRAAIESYAENLSDGVVAPLFYMLLFGLPGAMTYKAINTLDSMIGYRNERYENYGRISARIDDVANYIPSRLSALLILMCGGRLSALPAISRDGARHESPNAGLPISAMGYTLRISLGGPASYFGKIRAKPRLSKGRENIGTDDLHRALALHPKIESVLYIILFLGVLF